MISPLLTNLVRNKHTSAAGVVYLFAKFGTQAAAVWFPQHKEQLDSTANLVEGAAVAYGLLAAGDSGQSAAKEDVAAAIKSGDTTIFEKSRQPAPKAPDSKP